MALSTLPVVIKWCVQEKAKAADVPLYQRQQKLEEGRGVCGGGRWNCQSTQGNARRLLIWNINLEEGPLHCHHGSDISPAQSWQKSNLANSGPTQASIPCKMENKNVGLLFEHGHSLPLPSAARCIFSTQKRNSTLV